MQNLKEFSFSVPRDEVENFSDQLMELGALSVTVECHKGDEIIKDPLSFESIYWDENFITALVDEALGPVFESLGPIKDSMVPDLDWVLQVQKNTPIQVIDQKLWIVPSWHKIPEEAKTVLLLDPKNAFGTGDHATTHLCLEWIVKNCLEGKRIIDYGCGSGILMIAAKKLGATTVHGYDIDENAVRVAKQNCIENGIEASFDLDGVLADVVLANIHLSPLLGLKQTLYDLCADGAIVVLSGILSYQLIDLLQTYLPYFDLLSVDTMQGWMRIVLKKKTIGLDPCN
jgi:ribosomal protein L11 methyltransferase